MATVMNFGDCTATDWAYPSKDNHEVTIHEIDDIDDVVHQPRQTSIEQEATLPHRRNSAGTESRIPTYHKDNEAKYCLPNDSTEHIRLETQAKHLSEMMNHKILHAPVPEASAKRTLDIGCGTGIVTDLLSQIFPSAECIGLDLSPVPPIRPHNSNVRFFQGNVTNQKPTAWTPNKPNESSLPQDENLFDYLFSRLLILGMSDWPAFLRKEFSLLKPGGWVEVQDLAWDWISPSGEIVSDDWEWLRWLGNHLEREKGIDVRCGNKAEMWMREAGFVDVQVFPYVLPFCGASEMSLAMREFGAYNAETVPRMLHYAIEKAVADGEVLTGELREKMDEMRAEMKATLVPGRGMYQIFNVTIGRKPE